MFCAIRASFARSSSERFLLAEDGFATHPPQITVDRTTHCVVELILNSSEKTTLWAKRLGSATRMDTREIIQSVTGLFGVLTESSQREKQEEGRTEFYPSIRRLRS